MKISRILQRKLWARFDRKSSNMLKASNERQKNFIQEQKLTSEKDYRSFSETTPNLIKKHKKTNKKPCDILNKKLVYQSDA